MSGDKLSMIEVLLSQTQGRTEDDLKFINELRTQSEQLSAS